MQLLSAYLLETPSLSEGELATRLEAVLQEVAAWLTAKGSVDPNAVRGEFESLTKDGSGNFSREGVLVPSGRLEEIRLEEFTRAGQIFTTYLAVTAHSEKLRVYCALDVANAESVVAPLPIDPRCPSIVRKLLARFSDWRLNDSPHPLPYPMRMNGDVGGRHLAEEIRNPNRSLPIIVASELEGELVWPRLAEELASDLAGLAQVVTIDDDATWALSEEIGKLNSCYHGAVRLYWPVRRRGDFGGTVWTASALLSNDRDGQGIARFRSTLRRMLMSTAALSITPPPSIREIQDANSRRRIDELERRANPNSEELETARLYAKENQELKSKVEQLQAELARVAARAEATEHALGQRKAASFADQAELEAENESPEPVPGDVRFYKKTHSKAAYDVMVEVDDCGHRSWQASNKADKAKKGLERLLNRGDWKSLQHCGTCTNGGMWKVRW